MTTANQPLVRSASRCKAKLQVNAAASEVAVNKASSAASASANQAGFSVDRRGQAPSTAMRLGSARSMAAPATATTGARLTTVFQVSGCACAALIAAAFAPTRASVPVPTGSSPRYCECVLAATPYFTLVSRTSTPAAFYPAGAGRCTLSGR